LQMRFAYFLFLMLSLLALACLLPQRLLEGRPIAEPPMETAATPSSEPTATALPPAQSSSLQWQLVQREQRVELPEKNFSMTVQYPLIEGSDHPYVIWFNGLVEDTVQEKMDEDLRWFEELENPDWFSLFSDVYYSVPSRQGWSVDGSALGEEEGAALDAGQALFDGGHPVLSVVFIGVFYSGGAHPNSVRWPLNYDFATGSELALEDLFIPGAPYLERIADYCIAQLRATLDFAIWEDGAAPLAENYQDWAVTPEGLLIIFDEYQVAPYAAGPQEVVIPYDILADILHPQGALGRFAASE